MLFTGKYSKLVIVTIALTQGVRHQKEHLSDEVLVRLSVWNLEEGAIY